jgi:hypothetical protein
MIPQCGGIPEFWAVAVVKKYYTYTWYYSSVLLLKPSRLVGVIMIVCNGTSPASVPAPVPAILLLDCHLNLVVKSLAVIFGGGVVHDALNSKAPA